MKIAFFLGAGASNCAGMPHTKALMDGMLIAMIVSLAVAYIMLRGVVRPKFMRTLTRSRVKTS